MTSGHGAQQAPLSLSGGHHPSKLPFPIRPCLSLHTYPVAGAAASPELASSTSHRHILPFHPALSLTTNRTTRLQQSRSRTRRLSLRFAKTEPASGAAEGVPAARDSTGSECAIGRRGRTGHVTVAAGETTPRRHGRM